MTVHIDMINLGRAQERRDHMRPEMARAGFEAQFHPAFDFTEHDESELLALCKPEGPWGPFHIQNMAATISHTLAWERFLASDATHCLIMEDDIFISPDMGAWLDDLSWWPKQADVVKFERWISKSTKVLLEPPTCVHRGRKVQRMLSRHMGAAGYMLTRAAAEKLRASKPYDMVVDHILFNLNASKVARGLKIYQVSPALMLQGNEPEGSPFYMGARKRPKGLTWLRQKLKRLYYEVAYPLPTIWKLITKQATLTRIPFEKSVPFQDAADHSTPS